MSDTQTTDHLAPVREAKAMVEQEIDAIREGIRDAETDLAQLRQDRDIKLEQLADLNRALGLRADGTPRRQKEAKADGQAEANEAA